MANSIQTIGNNTLLIEDMSLLLALSVMRSILVDSKDVSKERQCILDLIEETLDGHAPGCIDLRCEELVSDVPKLIKLLALIQEARQEVVRQGPIISAGVIRRRWPVKRVRYHNVSGNAIEVVFIKLAEFLESTKDRVTRQANR